MKKDNKGFSLVELIVVVLIMGILAVALTPQVLKWVKNARIANDRALMDSIVSNCQTALTNEKALAEVTETLTITVTGGTSGATTMTPTTVTATNLKEKIAEYSGYIDSTTKKGDWSKFDDTKVQVAENKITITIEKGGRVTGKYTNSAGTSEINVED